MDTALSFNLIQDILNNSTLFTHNQIRIENDYRRSKKHKAGRLSIPQSLREYAHLSKDCVVLGINKYLELWNYELYHTYLEESEISFKTATEQLSNICF